MVPAAVSQASILIASDSPMEAALVKTLLEDDFEHVAAATDPDSGVREFQRCHPLVLIAAFRDLQAAEDFYLGIHRLGTNHPPQPHRAILLCGKEGVQQAYERCRRGLFDDYVVFWPVTHDVRRLHMSVYSALDELREIRDEKGLVATCAEQAHRLAELESLLSEQLSRGREHIASTGRAVAGAEQGISRALDSLSAGLASAGSPKTLSDGLAELALAIDRCRSEAVLPQLQRVSASLTPLTDWAGHVQAAVAPYMESARALGALAGQDRGTIMVVDDDDFQRKLTAKILESEGYRVELAANGSDALGMLRRTQPDLILTDFLMPEMNGIELTQRIKSYPAFAGIPIIMLTGNSEREVVFASLKSGVIDFIVKPFDRSALIDKLGRVLSGSAA
jgi:CheY-like chemotaxis protein